MNKIFGDERVQVIKKQLEVAKAPEREGIIIKHLDASLKEIGAKYVVPYVVVPENEEHVSHYIVGITKHERGYEELKKRLRIDSKISEKAQASFGFDLASIAREAQHSIFEVNSPRLSRIELLANQLHAQFQGQVKLFEPMYRAHHPTTEYTEAEYKQAIRHLLNSGKVRIPDIDEAPARKSPKGEQAIGPQFKIRFV